MVDIEKLAVLIIGGGLVGSQIAKLELERGTDEQVVIFDIAPRPEALADILNLEKVKIIQGDMLNLHDLYRTIKSNKINRIIHTAANPGLTMGAHRNPYQAIQLNIVGTMNVLEAARVFDIDRVVMISSSVIDVFSAESPTERSRPGTIYASTKLSCEHLGLNYSDWYGVSFVAVRFPAVFGPWRYGGGGGYTIMFKDLVENAQRGQRAEITSEVVEYLYSKDAARACAFACHAEEGKIKSRIYNVGMGRIYKPEEIKSTMKQIVPSAKIDIVSRESTSGPKPKPQEIPMDLTTTKLEVGYDPEYDMRTALEDYVGWRRTVQSG